MNVFNKKLEKKRYGNHVLDALQLVIPAVILTADDIWCVTNEQTQQLVQGSFEIIQGYQVLLQLPNIILYPNAEKACGSLWKPTTRSRQNVADVVKARR